MNSSSYEKVINLKTKKISGVISLSIFFIFLIFTLWLIEQRDQDILKGINTHEENISYLLNLGNQFELRRIVSTVERSFDVKIVLYSDQSQLLFGEVLSYVDEERMLRYNNRLVGRLLVKFNRKYNSLYILLGIILALSYVVIYRLSFYLFNKNSRKIIDPILSLFEGRSINKSLLENNDFIKSEEGEVLLNLIKKNEEAIKNNAITSIALGVSHDLRSPVSSLMSILSLIETKMEKKLTQDEIKLIRMSILRIEQISNELLETKRELKIKNNLQNIVKWTEDVFFEKDKEFIDSAPNVKLDLKIKLDNINENNSYRVSESDYKRIISNLVNNSYESLNLDKDNNMISITLSGNTNNLVVSIIDSGVGIEKSVLEDIERNRHVTTKANGNGIGLSLIREKLKKIDGKLNLSSSTNNGTIVDVIIPSMI